MKTVTEGKGGREVLVILATLVARVLGLLAIPGVQDAAWFLYFMVVFGAAIAWHFGWPLIVGFLGLDVVVMATFAVMLVRRSQLERRQS
ncbi:MAG: hypothetical protein K8T20_12585 [Planctomycetes bacterium]|nr:hypothetical protein [Planctomycetota bacterium]